MTQKQAILLQVSKTISLHPKKVYDKDLYRALKFEEESKQFEDAITK